MRLLHELLQVAVGRRETLSETPGAQEWTQAYEQSKRHGLQAVLWDVVCKLPKRQKEALFKDVAAEWEQRAQTVGILSDVHLGRSRELALWLDSKGVDACVLKGMDYARYYPSGTLRLSGDIDVWIPHRRADVLRMFSGFFTYDILWQECKVKFWPNESADVHFWPTKMYHPGFRLRLGRLCAAEERPFEMCADGFRTPSLRFSAVFCLLHMFRHAIDGGVGLRQFMDCCCILDACGEQERAFAAKWLGSLGVKRFASDAMWVLGEVFGLEREKMLFGPSAAGGRKLLSEVMTGGNFGRWGRDSRDDVPTRLGKAFMRTMNTLGFALRYPREALWAPAYKIWHYCWRVVHGY